jgi:hypothetical protein
LLERMDNASFSEEVLERIYLLCVSRIDAHRN